MRAAYVELHCHSAYSFLDGASQPEELAARAAELGYEALALTDHDGVYGSLEFAHAAKALGVRPITGAEVTLDGGAHVTLLVESRRGYGNLCRILTTAHAETRAFRVGAGHARPLQPSVSLDLVAKLSEGLVCLSGCARRGLGLLDPNAAVRLAAAFGRERFLVELQRPFERGDTRRLNLLRDLAAHLDVETVATGDVHAHHPRRTLLQDVLVAIRCRTSLEGCEPERRGNRESYLRAPEEMLERFPFDRAAAERSAVLAERLEFDLTEELGYRYPDFSGGDEPAIRQLAAICRAALDDRYGSSRATQASPLQARVGARLASPSALRKAASERLDSELALIEELGLAGFFL
ncbi:MAG TPA: PHP domain-containing protein, partial [Gaiellaceae bacterium]|nr:PHP domain-containing protein [Gaiellaceae bacterium]